MSKIAAPVSNALRIIPLGTSFEREIKVSDSNPAGAYGIVVPYVDEEGKTTRRLKIMRKSWKKGGSDDIIREVSASRYLSHPNIIKAREVVFIDSTIDLKTKITEDFSKKYIPNFEDLKVGIVFEGGCLSLNDVLKNSPDLLLENRTGEMCTIDRPLADFIPSLMYQLLSGLLYMHQRGIIHRDIKPSNIIVYADPKFFKDLRKESKILSAEARNLSAEAKIPRVEARIPQTGSKPVSLSQTISNGSPVVSPFTAGSSIPETPPKEDLKSRIPSPRYTPRSKRSESRNNIGSKSDVKESLESKSGVREGSRPKSGIREALGKDSEAKASPLLLLQIADLGAARFGITGDEKEHYSRDVVTIWYRAPEIAERRMKQGGDIHYEYISDLWSVGVVFYELLTRNHLVVAYTDDELLDGIKNLYTPDGKFSSSLIKNLYDAGGKRSPWVTDEALDLLRQLLEPDPDKRISSEEALLHPYFNNPSVRETITIFNIPLPRPICSTVLDRSRKLIDDEKILPVLMQIVYSINNIAREPISSALFLNLYKSLSLVKDEWPSEALIIAAYDITTIISGSNVILSLQDIIFRIIGKSISSELLLPLTFEALRALKYQTYSPILPLIVDQCFNPPPQAMYRYIDTFSAIMPATLLNRKYSLRKLSQVIRWLSERAINYKAEDALNPERENLTSDFIREAIDKISNSIDIYYPPTRKGDILELKTLLKAILKTI